MTVLVTGSNGFIGHHIVRTFVRQGIPVRASFRSLHLTDHQVQDCVIVGDIGPTTDWIDALKGITEVIHTAARQHCMRDKEIDALRAFRHVNVLGTLNFARQAATMGVRRFVFVSSIKVNGESTKPEHAFTSEDAPAPEDHYGLTKLEAEEALFELAKQTGMEVVIVRPPLVYGHNVKGNFASIIRALKKGLPLPFGSITNNRRSMVSIDNLVSLLITCLTHPMAVNQVFMVRDDEDLSTAEFLRRLGLALGMPARLVPVPQALLRLGAAALGRRDLARRLFGSLQVDDRKTRELLNWVPVQSVDDGFRSARNTIA